MDVTLSFLSPFKTLKPHRLTLKKKTIVKKKSRTQASHALINEKQLHRASIPLHGRFTPLLSCFPNLRQVATFYLTPLHLPTQIQEEDALV